MPKIDAPTTAPEARGKRWVHVPEKDLFDIEFPTIRINLTAYAPGKHYLDAEVADFVEDRIIAKQNADLRVMRPSQDISTQNVMNRFGIGAGRGTFARNPDAEMAG